jgi:hypothetical protein
VVATVIHNEVAVVGRAADVRDLLAELEHRGCDLTLDALYVPAWDHLRAHLRSVATMREAVKRR